MNTHNEFLKEMVEKCPLLYGDIIDKVPLRFSSMGFGFAIKPGWFDLVRQLSLKLEKILEEMPEKEQLSFRACQVKQKFGELRFYLHGGTHEMRKLIIKAQDLSCEICEVCGSEGELRNDLPWIACLCDTHYERRLEDPWRYE